MTKLILKTVFAVVTVIAVSVAVVSKKTDNNQLLAANIEALTYYEAADDPEASPYAEVWSTYIVRCVVNGAVTSATGWAYDHPTDTYYATTGPGSPEIPYDPYNPGLSFFNPVTYQKVVCGKGGDRCSGPVVLGHPCVEYPY